MSKMSMNDFIMESERTAHSDLSAPAMRLVGHNLIELLHGTMGVRTDAGEMLDAIKKHVFYGKPLDMVNLQEEMGDVLWYLALMCRSLGCDFEGLAKMNIEKLKLRFPEKFDEQNAINRNLNAERNQLELSYQGEM